MKIPAFMSKFSINPKPAADIHPNGVKGVKSVKMGTGTKEKELIEMLCQDERLLLYIGDGFQDLEFYK